MSTDRKKIATETNLDLKLIPRGKDAEGNCIVEALVIKFKEEENGSKSVVKSISAQAEAKGLEKANNAALKLALELMGL